LPNRAGIPITTSSHTQIRALPCGNISDSWRQLASEEKSDATKIEGKLDDMVKKSLEKYPPKQK
jgi:hypothetical protein